MRSRKVSASPRTTETRMLLLWGPPFYLQALKSAWCLGRLPASHIRFQSQLSSVDHQLGGPKYDHDEPDEGLLQR
jgi:hypothetical protein